MEVQIKFDSTDPELLKQLMKEHGNSTTPFTGENTEGELILISIFPDKIVTATYQSNGWIRNNFFDENGYPCGETFEK